MRAFFCLFLFSLSGVLLAQETDYSWLTEKGTHDIKEISFTHRKEPHLDPSSFDFLDGLVKALKDNPQVKLDISIWTNKKGRKKPNLMLSKRRADIICWYLIGAGISPERLSSSGKGEEEDESVRVTVSYI